MSIPQERAIHYYTVTGLIHTPSLDTVHSPEGERDIRKLVDTMRNMENYKIRWHTYKLRKKYI